MHTYARSLRTRYNLRRTTVQSQTFNNNNIIVVIIMFIRKNYSYRIRDISFLFAAPRSDANKLYNDTLRRSNGKRELKRKKNQK